MGWEKLPQRQNPFLCLGCDKRCGPGGEVSIMHGCFDNTDASVGGREMDIDFPVLCWHQWPLRGHTKYSLMFEMHKWWLRFHHTCTFQHNCSAGKNHKIQFSCVLSVSAVLLAAGWITNPFHPSIVPLSAGSLCSLSNTSLVECNPWACCPAHHSLVRRLNSPFDFFFSCQMCFSGSDLFFSLHFWVLSNSFVSLQVCFPKVDFN